MRLLVLLALCAPLATASWGVQGSVEPDTPYDLEGLVPLEPDRDPDPTVARVYFNAVAKQGVWTYASQRANPNLVEGSRLAPAATFQASAYLGIWKDCDGDGYVGTALGAWMQYPAALLSDTSVCPDGGPYNRDGWVREFRWITDARDTTTVAGRPSSLAEPHVVVDPEAAVWGDFGRPGAAPAEAPCDATKPPRGTTARTGGLLALADCAAQRAPSRQVFPSLAVAGLAFDDAQRPERDCDHPLNRPVGLWPDANACALDADPQLAPGGASMYTVAECRDGAPAPVLRPGESTGTVHATYTEAQEATVVCSFPAGSARHYALQGTSPYLLYYPHVAVTTYVEKRGEASDLPPGKRVADHPMTFAHGGTKRADVYLAYPGYALDLYDARRGALPPPPDAPDGPIIAAVGPAPLYAGLSPAEAFAGAGWETFATPHLAPHYAGHLVRGDLAPAGPLWLTFYAKVGTVTRALAQAPDGGIYGSEVCGPADLGVQGGWDCDASHWWSLASGVTPPPMGTYGARPGERYQLRDVDCLDGDVAATGLRASLNEACPRL